MIYFVYLDTQLWKFGWFISQKPGKRTRTWALVMANVFSISRIGEYVKSTCRSGTKRELYYQVGLSTQGLKWCLSESTIGRDSWSVSQ